MGPQYATHQQKDVAMVGEACTQTTTTTNQDHTEILFYISDIFETILYELIHLMVSLKVVYIRDPGETQSVTLGIFNMQLTHRSPE